jgi:hypothetical protein
VPNSSPLRSTPGRTRTCGECLFVGEVPSPLGHGGSDLVGPAGVEPAFHRVSDGRLAARPRPACQRPVRDSNPSRLLDRQVATPAASQGGKSVAGVAPAYPTRQVGAWAARPRTHEQGRKESNPLRQGWSLTALPGAHPCQSAEGTGLEPARACASPGFRPGAIMPVGSPFRIELSRQDSNLHPSG